PMAGLQEATAVTISGAFVFGVVLVLLGTFRPALQERFGLNEIRADWLSATLHLALIPMMLLAGMFVDDVGAKAAMLIGSMITALALLGLSLSQNVGSALGSIVAMAAGGACLSSASTVLMSKAFFPENEAASQNLGNVFFGLGALMTPAVASVLLRRL